MEKNIIKKPVHLAVLSAVPSLFMLRIQHSRGNCNPYCMSTGLPNHRSVLKRKPLIVFRPDLLLRYFICTITTQRDRKQVTKQYAQSHSPNIATTTLTVCLDWCFTVKRIFVINVCDCIYLQWRHLKKKKEEKVFCDLTLCCVGPHGPHAPGGPFREKKEEPMNRICARWNNMLWKSIRDQANEIETAWWSN